MRAIALRGFDGFESLSLVEAPKPHPAADEVLIEVKAAGINFAELELTRGRYPAPKEPPFIMGFEAAGIVAEVGPRVEQLKIGDKITALASSGGYAEYATASASTAIPIPEGVSFAEATTITIQGLSAYALLKYAARPQMHESVLIQAAAGGVGLYLVQLAKAMGVKTVIALAGSQAKLDLVRKLGADVAINYRDTDWADQVREATGANGVDVVLEAASGRVGAQSFELIAPFGRIVVFGARNIHDSIPSSQMEQIIRGNRSVIGFNFPTLRAEQIAACVPQLLNLISQGRVRLFADNAYPLADARLAFEALSSRQTIGKVVLTP